MPSVEEGGEKTESKSQKKKENSKNTEYFYWMRE
jgi:hypothetical protein